MVLAGLVTSGVALAAALAIGVFNLTGWITDMLAPALVGYAAIGGMFFMYVSFLVFALVLITFLVFLVKKKGSLYLPTFYFSLLNAVLGLLGALIVSGRI
jgi:hypothetical protein